MPGWKPIHENHAIDVMAAVVTFAQPLPHRLLASALKASEEVAFAAGLKSRHSSRALQLTIGPDGITAPSDVPQGLVFNALFESDLGEPIPGKIAEQLQIDAQNIVYRTWRYVSWTWQKKRMRSLMTPALEIVAPAVAMAKMRLEYYDRFSFDGDLAAANVSALLHKQSKYLTPAIFSASDQWHSHTGAFLDPAGDAHRKLQQINVDAVNQPDPSDASRTIRWVNILTAREEQYTQAGIDDREINANIIFDDFDRLHSELKTLISEVITDDMAAKIYLVDQKK